MAILDPVAEAMSRETVDGNIRPVRTEQRYGKIALNELGRVNTSTVERIGPRGNPALLSDDLLGLTIFELVFAGTKGRCDGRLLRVGCFVSHELAGPEFVFDEGFESRT